MQRARRRGRERSSSRGQLSGALAALGLTGLAACGTTEGAEQRDAPAAAEEQAEQLVALDGEALCRARAEVEDLQALDALAGARAELQASGVAAGAPPADRYRGLLAVESEQERWRGFKQLAPDLAKLRALGECEVYAEWKMPDQAAEPCRAAREHGDALALVERAEAVLAQKRGKLDEAEGHLEAALKADPNCVPVRRAYAALLEEQGETDQALVAWEAALVADPTCASCAIAKAELKEAIEGVEAALPLWEAALELAPAHAPTLQRYAAAQVGRDDEQALAAYEKALEKNAEDFGTLMAAARLAQKVGELVKAVEYAEEAASLQPDDVDVWRLSAELYQAREEMTGFEKALTEVLRLLPEDPAAHHELGRLAVKDGAFVRALEHYAAALEHYEEGEAKAAAAEELKKLNEQLLIAQPGPSGDANRVVGHVQRTARKVYESRLAEKEDLKGSVKLQVTTDKTGEVQQVEITSDTLKDPQVTASLVGNLRAARIDGGAQRLSFELSFE